METLHALVLVGGKGTRLAAITEGKISKGMVTIDQKGEVTGTEHIARVLRKLDVQNVSLLAKNHADQYEGFARDMGYDLLVQEGETGTGGAIEEAIQRYGEDRQFLVMSVDTYMKAHDVRRLMERHERESVTWGVSKYNPEAEMEQYHGLLVDKGGQVWGDRRLSWHEEWPTHGYEEVTKGAVNLVDPRLFGKAAEYWKGATQATTYDLYWDLLPYLMTRNRNRMMDGKRSIVNAVKFEFPLIDYGTPNRLYYTRRLYSGE